MCGCANDGAKQVHPLHFHLHIRTSAHPPIRTSNPLFTDKNLQFAKNTLALMLPGNTFVRYER